MVDERGGTCDSQGREAPANAAVAEPTAPAVHDLTVEDLIALLDLPVVSRGSDASDEPDEPEHAAGASWLDTLEHPERGAVEWLGELAPSGLLLSELEGLPADALQDDYEAVELVSHWHRLEAYCASQKRVAAAALARRHAMAEGLAALKDLNGGLGVVTGQANIAVDELAARLGIGTRAARRLVESGRAFSGVAIPVAEALAAGQIDAVKADMIVDALTDLTPDEALDVQERVLSRAGHLPSGSVRRELVAACAAVDPAEFEDRAQQAAKGRRVCRPRVLPHGMAGFYAELPAFEATQLYRAVDAAARSAKANGDPRTMDQLRADALALQGSIAVRTGWIGKPPQQQPGPDPEHPGERDEAALAPREPGPPMRVGQIGGRSAHVRVVVPLHSLMGAHPPAGRQHVAPPGSTGTAVPTARSGRTAVEGTAAPTGNDPPPAEGTALPATTGAVGAVVAGEEMNGPCAAEHPDAPAFLEGYGPLPASVARAVAAGSVWARLVLDPVDGTVRELTTPKYRPPAAMADLVRAEQPECGVPGCSVPADECDLDHAIPWPRGQTCVDDLGPRCRRHHLLRTHAGWTFTTGADRRHTWTTATGHAYTEHPDGAITHVPRHDDAPPPF